MWKFDTTLNAWSLITQVGTIPDARFATISWFNSATGRLIFFGGNAYSGGNNQRNDMWSFNPVTSQWSNLPINLADNSIPIPAVDSPARWLDSNNTLWIFSGRIGSNVQYMNDIWALGTFP